jgi:hypothetical protein
MICRYIQYSKLRPTKLSQDRYESEAFYICQGQDLALFVCDRRRNNYNIAFLKCNHDLVLRRQPTILELIT